jgi:uncharacterized protein (TIGR02421 family)
MSIEELTKGIERIEAAVNPVTLIAPLNKRDVKLSFVEYGDMPAFEYPTRPHRVHERELLASLRALAHDLPDLLRSVIEPMLTSLAFKIDLSDAVGTDRVRDISLALYGGLESDTIKSAHRILKSPDGSKPPESLVDASVVAAQLSQALESYGLDGWSVSLDEREITAVIHSERVIRIPKHKRFAPDHAHRLIAHEVGVHVLRAENGRAQPFSLLSIGLPGYYETEEGIAVYTEVSLDTISEFTLRQYALRVIAVENVLRDLTMLDSCRRLRDEFGLTDSQSFDISYRAYRGGGFIKDHVYLQGFYTVRDFVRSHDLAELYVGKVGIEHRKQIAALRDQGWVTDPQRLPDPMPDHNGFVESL